jgi:hypothetical protein
MVFTEQTKIHIDPGYANLYIRFIVNVHTCQRPTGADQCAADAVFPAVILVKGKYRSQDTGDAMLSCVSTDNIMWTRSDTVATATAESL